MDLPGAREQLGGHCPIYPPWRVRPYCASDISPSCRSFYEKQARRGARMRANESAPGAHRTRQKQEFAGFALSKAGGGGAKHSIVRRACGPAAFTCASQKFSAI